MRPRPRLVFAAASALALGLLAAGCGGGGNPGVASVASSTAATPPQTGAVAFARCMRSHGVPGFPDPGSGGAFDGSALKQLRVGKSQMRAAQGVCIHLLPNGAVPIAPGYTLTPADRADYLKAAACMRRHGFPDFPDPTFTNGRVGVEIPASIDQSSPLFERAAETCTKLVPKGLPYSRPRGS